MLGAGAVELDSDDDGQSQASRATVEDIQLDEHLGVESDDSLFAFEETPGGAVAPVTPPVASSSASNGVAVPPLAPSAAQPAPDPPRVEPPPASARPGRERQQRPVVVQASIGCALATVHVDGARIALYPGRGDIEATCKNKGHGRCVLTKRYIASALRPSQGRPLGLAMAWAAKAFDCCTKAEHRSEEHWPTKAERIAGRELLKQMASTDRDAQTMLDLERPKAAGEDSEPDDV